MRREEERPVIHFKIKLTCVTNAVYCVPSLGWEQKSYWQRDIELSPKHNTQQIGTFPLSG